jgi:hypothetical protein
VRPPSLLKLGLFQIVWLACGIGAAVGISWPGILAAAVLVTLHLGAAQQRVRAATTVLAAGALGFVAESLLAVAGLVQYSAAWPTQLAAPAWIVGLWLAFATTLGTTRRLLGPSALIKSALLGVIFGPLSYIAGERLGALALTEPAWRGYIAIAVVWGLALPVLLALERVLEQLDA